MQKILVLAIDITIDKTSSRILKQCKSLQDHGCEVLVLSKKNKDQLVHEVIYGVSIQRIPLFMKRFPSNFIFHFFKFFEMYFKIKNLNISCDVIDGHALYSLLIGYWLKKKNHAKLIFNAHELETEYTGLKGFNKRIHKFLEKRLINKCDAVITVSKSIEEWYRNEYTIDNVSCIFNAPSYTDDFDFNNNYFREYFNISSESIIFLYQGGLEAARGIELLIDCFKILPSKYVVIFMGYGSLSDYIKLEAKNTNNIFYHDAVSMTELKNVTSSADYGMSLIAPVSLNEEYCMPNKLFEYIMYGVPVIGFNTKDQAEFIRQHNVGYVLENYDINSLKELILSIDFKNHSYLKENVRKIRKDISWDSMEKQLLSIYAAC